MVVVYLGIGLLLLFSPPDNFLRDESTRRILGGIMLAYGLFRGIQAWLQRKEINRNNDH